MQGSGQGAAERVTLLSIIVGCILVGLKAAVAFWSGSTALLADAVHSGADVVATLAVLGGVVIAGRPPDADHPYGHEKAEPVAAKIVAVLLFLSGLVMGWESVRALMAAAVLPGISAIWMAALGMLIKFLLGSYVARAGRRVGSVALQADAFNHRVDALASGAVLIGVAGARLGFARLDPLMGLLVSALVLRMAISLYWRGVRDLMDTAPDATTLERIRSTTLATPGVVRLDGLKARVHGNGFYVDLKIAVDDQITVAQGHAIAQHVVDAVHSGVSGTKAVLVHINPAGSKG